MGNSGSVRHRGRQIALADKYRDPHRLINCMVLGDEDSGRDALIMRYLGNEPPTPGAPEVPVFTEKVCFSLIARQRLYNVMLYSVPSDVEHLYYFPRPDVIIVCFSLVSKDSKKGITEKWAEFCRREKVPVVLAGNYSELRDALEQVDEEQYDIYGDKLTPIDFSEGVSLGGDIGALTYIETNLESGLGVEKVFFEAAYATKKRIPLEIGVRDCTVAHRDSVALKRYNYEHNWLVSHKMFLENDRGEVYYGM